MRRCGGWMLAVSCAVACAHFVSAQGTGPSLYRGGAERLGYCKEAVAPPLSLLWKFTTAPYRNNGATPVVTGDSRLFFAVNKEVYGVDAETGDSLPLWKKKQQDGSYQYHYPLTDSVASPLAYLPPNLLLFGTKASRDKSLIALHADKGTAAWDFNAGSAVYSSPVVVGNNQILFATTSGSVWGGTVSEDGMSDTWKVQLEGATQGALAYANGLAFAVASEKLYGIHVAQRRIAWQMPMGDTTQSGPVLVGDQVVVAAGERLIGFSQKTGSRIWQQAIAGGARIAAAPAVRGTTLYFGADEYVYAYDLAQRRNPWNRKVKVDGRVLASPFVTDNGVFVGTARGFLVGLNATDGSLLWNYKMPANQLTTNSVTAAPFVVNGRLFAVGDDGTLFAFSAENIDVGEPTVIVAHVKLIARDRMMAKYPIEPWADDLGPDDLFMMPGKGPISFEFILEDHGSGINWDTVRVFLDDAPVKLKVDPIDGSINQIKSTVTVELVARATEGSTGRPLADGVHKIKLQVRNWAGNELIDLRPIRVNNSAAPPEAPSRTDAGAGGNQSGGLGGSGFQRPGGRGGGGSGGSGRGGGGSGS